MMLTRQDTDNTPSPSPSPSRFPSLDLVRPHFRPDIEGLRAIAIILVVGYHSGIPLFKGGFIGVDIFFVLSGYLITWLLVYEGIEKGAINLAKFYARRARRLLPALTVVLLVSILVGAILFAPFEQKGIANSAGATSAYLSNFYFALESLNYFKADVSSNPFLHTWSLGVEEQFYIIWPLLVMFSLGVLRWQKPRHDLRRLILLMGCVSIVSFLFSLYLTNERQPWAFFLSPARAWEFSVGALALLIPSFDRLFIRFFKAINHQEDVFIKSIQPKLIRLLAWIGFLGIFYCAYTFDDKISFPGVTVLLPVFSILLVLRAGTFPVKTGIEKILGFSVLQTIGRLSYSWYLWHWPVLVFATVAFGEIATPVRLVLIAFSLLLAELSYRLIENPIRYHPGLVKNSFRSLGLAFLTLLVGVGLSFSWRQISLTWAQLPSQVLYTNAVKETPSVNPFNCHADFFKIHVDIANCTFGSKISEKTMILIGDSQRLSGFQRLRLSPKMRGGVSFL